RALLRARARRPLVEEEPPAHRLPEAQPELVRGQLSIGCVEPCPTLLPGDDLPEDGFPRARGAPRRAPPRPPRRTPPERAPPGADPLRAHAARAEGGRLPERLVRDRVPLGDELRPRLARGPGDGAPDLGAEDEQASLDAPRDLRREGVGVAERDLVRRRGVVLVHDRHGPKREERL